MAAVFKPIIPKKFLPKRLQNVIEDEANRIADSVLIDFNSTTATWNNRPVFRRTVNATSNRITISVITTSRIYGYVDEGTRIRYATMTPNFVPKTQPNVIGSSAGRGGLAYVNRNRPRPGIQARNFSSVIKRRYERGLNRRLLTALARGVFQSGHRI